MPSTWLRLPIPTPRVLLYNSDPSRATQKSEARWYKHHVGNGILLRNTRRSMKNLLQQPSTWCKTKTVEA